MKKWLCHIFNIYLCVISCQPCTDIHTTEVLTNLYITPLSADNHTNCPHEKEGDNCSPFCVCSCCGYSVSLPKYSAIVSVETLIIAGRQIIYPSDAFNLQEVYLHVWRPPIVLTVTKVCDRS